MVVADVVALLEAAYAWEEPDAIAWLAGIASAASAAFDLPSLGAYALVYDASNVRDFRVERFATSRVLNTKTHELLESGLASVYRRHPELVDAVFRRTAYGPSRTLRSDEGLREAHAMLAAHRIGGILGFNGVNIDGRSVHAGLLLPDESAPVVPKELCLRLSSHLAASYRLRSRLAGTADLPEDSDAVLTMDGKIAHAERTAKLPEARAALAGAAVAIDRARGSLRRRDPDRAVAMWRTLVDATWSLVDRFERDGKHYLVARRNEPSGSAVEELSDRERQVVALAALGHANKMIGYELGIATSTVGVLLGRAARRLGVHSRAELVALYEAHSSKSVQR